MKTHWDTIRKFEDLLNVNEGCFLLSTFITWLIDKKFLHRNILHDLCDGGICQKGERWTLLHKFAGEHQAEIEALADKFLEKEEQ